LGIAWEESDAAGRGDEGHDAAEVIYLVAWPDVDAVVVQKLVDGAAERGLFAGDAEGGSGDADEGFAGELPKVN